MTITIKDIPLLASGVTYGVSIVLLIMAGFEWKDVTTGNIFTMYNSAITTLDLILIAVLLMFVSIGACIIQMWIDRIGS